MNAPMPRIEMLGDDEGATYVEVLMLQGLGAAERGTRIGHAMVTPCLEAVDGLDAMQRLHFWNSLIAYLMGMAESSVGAEGRQAIVHCMRSACCGPADREALQ
jgi:3-methyladenine DNA glycosylase AlkD